MKQLTGVLGGTLRPRYEFRRWEKRLDSDHLSLYRMVHSRLLCSAVRDDSCPEEAIPKLRGISSISLEVVEERAATIESERCLDDDLHEFWTSGIVAEPGKLAGSGFGGLARHARPHSILLRNGRN
jgi:hypothetical protein